MSTNKERPIILSGEPAPRAVFSEGRRYRYTLPRVFGTGEARVLFILLNPSTADDEQDDPTVRRCIAYAKAWGASRLDVCNLFALRSTNPQALYFADDPVGPDNNMWIGLVASSAHLVVCGWGNHGELDDRGLVVIDDLRRAGIKPHALRITRAGHPWHPLYLPKNIRPFPMETTWKP